MIKITSKKDGFRRCGVVHTKRTQTHDDKRFSDEELAQLSADVMLVVEVVKNEKVKEKKAEVKKDG